MANSPQLTVGVKPAMSCRTDSRGLVIAVPTQFPPGEVDPLIQRLLDDLEWLAPNKVALLRSLLRQARTVQ